MKEVKRKEFIEKLLQQPKHKQLTQLAEIVLSPKTVTFKVKEPKQ